MSRAAKTAGPRSPLQYGLKKSERALETILETLRNGYSVSKACAAIGIARSTAEGWKRNDPEFAAKWADAMQTGTDRLEDEAYRRAVEGTERPVFQGGELVGHIREYSDTMTGLLLKGRRREVYGDRQVLEGPGPDGDPIKVEHSARDILAGRIDGIAKRSAETGGPGGLIGEPVRGTPVGLALLRSPKAAGSGG